MAYGICFEESLFVEFDLVYQEPFSGIVTLTTRISFQSGQWFNSWSLLLKITAWKWLERPTKKLAAPPYYAIVTNLSAKTEEYRVALFLHYLGADALCVYKGPKKTRQICQK